MSRWLSKEVRGWGFFWVSIFLLTTNFLVTLNWFIGEHTDIPTRGGFVVLFLVGLLLLPRLLDKALGIRTLNRVDLFKTFPRWMGIVLTVALTAFLLWNSVYVYETALKLHISEPLALWIESVCFLVTALSFIILFFGMRRRISRFNAQQKPG
jgi:hypothetical protein